MSDRLTIWGRATSSNVQAVMWLVGELGLPHRRIDCGHAFGGLDAPEFRAMNPHGRIPVIRDGDGPPIFESGAILRYLAARYAPGTAFWPEDPAERAQLDKWAEWGKVSLGPAFVMPIFWATVRTPPSQQDPAAIAKAVSRFEALVARFLDALEGRNYLGGDEPSLADIQVGHMLFRYYEMQIGRGDLPELRAYYDRLAERPAYRQHVMVDYEALRATD